MSIDPYTDVAQWLDMDARTAAIMRHPAGKGLMSAEQQQAIMDAESCDVGSTNWQGDTPPTRRSTIGHVAGIIAVFALVSCAPFLADVAGVLA